MGETEYRDLVLEHSDPDGCNAEPLWGLGYIYHSILRDAGIYDDDSPAIDAVRTVLCEEFLKLWPTAADYALQFALECTSEWDRRPEYDIDLWHLAADEVDPERVCENYRTNMTLGWIKKREADRD